MHRLTRLAARVMISNVRDLSLPYRLTYAVTRKCQARCAMCNIWKLPTGNELSLTEIDAFFHKADRFSWINLTGGELFQRQDVVDVFLAIIGRCRHLYLLNFPTNGLQTEDILYGVDTILNQTGLPRLIVSVSMDGPPDLHDQIRGVPGCWDRAMQTFAHLKQRTSRRFSVYLGHTVQKANIGRFAETLDACRSTLPDIKDEDFHVNLAHSSSHYYGNPDTEAIPDLQTAAREIGQISLARKRKILDPVAFVERRYQRRLKHYAKHGSAGITCQAAAASLFIDPDGTVFPCTGFGAPLGSLRKSGMDLYGIWRSQSRQEARERVRTGNCPGCWTPCEAYQSILGSLVAPSAYR